MKLNYIILIMATLIFLTSCSKTKLGYFEIEQSNWTMTEPYAVINHDLIMGDYVSEVIAPSPTGTIYMEFINDTYVRLYNERNLTIGYEDISKGDIHLESPTITYYS